MFATQNLVITTEQHARDS